MTDEELIRNLRRLTASYHENSASHELLTKLGRRFEELIGITPPARGSVAVRIAVMVGPSDGVFAIGVNPMGPGDEWSAAMRAFDSLAYQMQGDKPTHEAIVTAHIPRCVVPEVTGTVEAFDPEATI